MDPVPARSAHPGARLEHVTEQGAPAASPMSPTGCPPLSASPSTSVPLLPVLTQKPLDQAPPSLCPAPAPQIAQGPNGLYPPSCLPAALHPLCSPNSALACRSASPAPMHPASSFHLVPQVCGALRCAGQACPWLLSEPPKLPALLSAAAAVQVYPPHPTRPGASQ